MAKARLYLSKHLAKLPGDSRVSLNTRLFSDPLLSYMSHDLWVPTGGYHPLVPTCSIWVSAKVQLLHHYYSDRCSYCLVLEAKLREKRLLSVGSNQLDHTFKTICAKLPLIVGLIHLCMLFPNVITILGLISRFPNCPAAVKSHRCKGETERNQVDHQLGLGTQLLSLEKIWGKNNTWRRASVSTQWWNKNLTLKNTFLMSAGHNFCPKVIWNHTIYRNMFTKMHGESRKFLGVQARLIDFLRAPQAIPNFVIQGNVPQYL